LVIYKKGFQIQFKLLTKFVILIKAKIIMNLFSKFKQEFDTNYFNKKVFNCFLPIDIKHNQETSIKSVNGKPNEEYYKWQFLYSIVYSGMYAKDYIGTEVFFPKGNKNSAPIKFDAAIFDDKNWFEHYFNWRNNSDQKELDWLRKHLLSVVEFKKEDGKDIETVYNQQLKPALKDSERHFCLGILYDTERLFLFRKSSNSFLRLSDEYNQKGTDSGTKDLSLHLVDPYINIPTFKELIEWEHAKEKNREKRTLNDLLIISGIHSKQINDAMSNILRTMDKQGMLNQIGYQILIQILALKIFDEKKNEKTPTKFLEFYINENEKNFDTLNEPEISKFVYRMNYLRKDAELTYHRILKDNPLNIKNDNHIKILIEVVNQLQDYSFVLSHKTDLYQLVFYVFSTPFQQNQNAQFLTPLPLIDFLVSIVNPRNGETVIDPTVGIADFLSVSFVNSKSKLDDFNIFGIEVDDQMVMLATLNMLLNGDGNATVVSKPGYGSILSKFDITGNLIELIPDLNKKGNWENRRDDKKLKYFDVVLTNPPFGEDRAYRPKDKSDFDVIECYELWHLLSQSSNDKDVETSKKLGKDTSGKKWIDLGLVFLENAYRILKENGRLGIVLSNSLASIDRWQLAREWLMKKMRIVALFDLPANVFAETGVNTTLIVAYKPNDNELKKLIEQNYQVYVKDIQNVGYEIKTSKRVKKFEPTYKINYETFDIEIDKEGRPVINEDFTNTILDFRQWCKSQEKTLQDLFIKDK